MSALLSSQLSVVSPKTVRQSLNPNGYCCVIRLPKQKASVPPTAIQQRKEPWKSRKWMERFAENSELQLSQAERCCLLKDICRDGLWLICCPPCSTAGMANKLAFSAPRKPTYWPLMELNGAGPPHQAVPVSTKDLTGGVKVFWITTKMGHRIACMYVEFTISSSPVILYSHSNADDLGTIARHIRRLSRTLYCHVFAYDYSGYGLSEGDACIRNFYSDAEAAYLALRFFYGFNQPDIIFYGSSLGSVAAAHLAAKYSCRGLIMMASIPSGIRLLCRNSRSLARKKSSFLFDVLDNVTLARKIKCPVLVVHGDEDGLCSLNGAELLVAQLPHATEPAFFKGVGHDEVELFRRAQLRMSLFIHTECAVIWNSINEASDKAKPQ
ncbi:putative Protein ABHD17C [Hypsibius exemplaris]|uniref:Serine aminopeptidase S33 domain-containing protein n=1 Tax=Hypsibius exemplaris TaxID=2072580 RepID=A0A1W0WYD9_HYPEX|nr:putative Protein ABHD17C [Hypsibius exemplaris]